MVSKKNESISLISIAIGGILLKLLASKKKSEDGSKGPADATLWGYSVASLSLILLLFYTFTLSSKEAMKMGFFDIIKLILLSAFPVLFLLGVIIWTIIINIKFKDKINKGNVTSEYNKFDLISTILLVIQFLIIIKYIINKSDNISISTINNDSILGKAYDAFDENAGTISYLVGLFNYIILGLIQVSLEYFSTDG
jgi:hypothetical protein